ncbi:MAG: hypothetical protein O2910_03780 [Proteobacteria bacterium]|nr:hypothetical protein [Pseudomonadota bacterium]
MMTRAALIEAACRAYWGRAWDSLPPAEKINHRAGVMRTMEFLKKNGWAQPTQILGTQLKLAAMEAHLANLTRLARKVHREATEALPEEL